MTWLICISFGVNWTLSSGDKAENIKKRHLLTDNDKKRLILQNILSFRDMLSLIWGFDVQCKNISLNLMWTLFTSKKTDWFVKNALKLTASLTSEVRKHLRSISVSSIEMMLSQCSWKPETPSSSVYLLLSARLRVLLWLAQCKHKLWILMEVDFVMLIIRVNIFRSGDVNYL